MGLWAWTLNQLLSTKFMKSFKKEGFIYTYIRGHKAVRHSQDIGGRHGIVKCVGQDQFANRYFEDFDTDTKNTRRWVEYSNYFLSIGIGTDRIPAKWHGWLGYSFDDPPTEDKYFVNHHYFKEHTPLTSGTPLHYKAPGTVADPNRLEFIASTRARKYTSWEAPEGGDFNGKKLVVKKEKVFEDVME